MSKVAFLLASGFEDSEMKVPYEEVLQAGHQAEIIGLKRNETLLGKKGSVSYAADKAISEVQAADYDAVVIPGGSSPEKLRLDPGILQFVKDAS